MPTYDYKCSNCDHRFEEVQSMKDPLLTTCPKCGKETLIRLIGGGGVIFKGSGFYQTDYKPSGEKKASTTTEKKTETKPATTETTAPKSESKKE